MSFPEPAASRGIFHIALKSLPRFSMSNSRAFPSVTGTSTHVLSRGEKSAEMEVGRCMPVPFSLCPRGSLRHGLGSQDTPRPYPDTLGLMLVCVASLAPPAARRTVKCGHHSIRNPVTKQERIGAPLPQGDSRLTPSRPCAL